MSQTFSKCYGTGERTVSRTRISAWVKQFKDASECITDYQRSWHPIP